jgi:hypothetical protein
VLTEGRSAAEVGCWRNQSINKCYTCSNEIHRGIHAIHRISLRLVVVTFSGTPLGQIHGPLLHAAVLLLVLQVFVYLAGLQLLLTSGRKSVLVMVASTLAGVLYRLNFCGVRRLRVSSSSGCGFGLRDRQASCTAQAVSYHCAG